MPSAGETSSAQSAATSDAGCPQVCEQQGVPLSVVPLTDAYWERVVSHCVEEIRSGCTPNPDVLCNSRVKFGAFYDHLQAQHAGEFDRCVAAPLPSSLTSHLTLPSHPSSASQDSVWALRASGPF